LPASYPREDAVFNVQRSTLLIVALATGATDVFPTALEDRMHQRYRYALVPGLEEITRLRAPGLLGCALSGAGPSILVFHERGHENVCELVRAVFSRRGHASEIMCSSVAPAGYALTE
ncbi:MAG: homoserine kinase, partial [Bryobacteraceae bacterium]